MARISRGKAGSTPIYPLSKKRADAMAVEDGKPYTWWLSDHIDAEWIKRHPEDVEEAAAE